MTTPPLVKRVDRYFEEIAEGLNCRMRMFTPADPQETVVILVSWIPGLPNEVPEPGFSDTIAGLREGVLHLATSTNLHSFSLVEHHSLPGEERIGLITFGETPDSPKFWQSVERQALEELLGESLEAPLETKFTETRSHQFDNQHLVAS